MRSVLRSTHATILRVSTTAHVYRRTSTATTVQGRRSGVSALKGSGERRASGEIRASVLRA